MQDPGMKISYSSIDPDAVRMTILFIDRFRCTIKHIHWRIDPTTKSFPVQTIRELNCVTIERWLGLQALQFVDQLIGQDVIGIERQNPGRFDLCLCQTEVPLILMSVESSLKEPDLRIRLSNDLRFVIAETVDDNYVPGPGEL